MASESGRKALFEECIEQYEAVKRERDAAVAEAARLREGLNAWNRDCPCDCAACDALLDVLEQIGWIPPAAPRMPENREEAPVTANSALPSRAGAEGCEAAKMTREICETEGGE